MMSSEEELPPHWAAALLRVYSEASTGPSAPLRVYPEASLRVPRGCASMARASKGGPVGQGLGAAALPCLLPGSGPT